MPCSAEVNIHGNRGIVRRKINIKQEAAIGIRCVRWTSNEDLRKERRGERGGEKEREEEKEEEEEREEEGSNHNEKSMYIPSLHPAFLHHSKETQTKRKTEAMMC